MPDQEGFPKKPKPEVMFGICRRGDGNGKDRGKSMGQEVVSTENFRCMNERSWRAGSPERHLSSHIQKDMAPLTMVPLLRSRVTPKCHARFWSRVGEATPRLRQQERRDAYRMCGVSLSYRRQADELPEVKEVRPDVALVHSQVLQDVLKRVDHAFEGFFRRVAAGERPGYPRFQGKTRYDSFTFPQSGFGWKATSCTCRKSAVSGCGCPAPSGGKSRP